MTSVQRTYNQPSVYWLFYNIGSTIMLEKSAWLLVNRLLCEATMNKFSTTENHRIKTIDCSETKQKWLIPESDNRFLPSELLDWWHISPNSQFLKTQKRNHCNEKKIENPPPTEVSMTYSDLNKNCVPNFTSNPLAKANSFGKSCCKHWPMWVGQSLNDVFNNSSKFFQKLFLMSVSWCSISSLVWMLAKHFWREII